MNNEQRERRKHTITKARGEDDDDDAQARTPLNSSLVGKTGNDQQKRRTKKKRGFYWSPLEASQEIGLKMKRFIPRSKMQRLVSEDSQQQEMELFESSKERAAYDNLADLYTIILATEHLERAYARDAIDQKDYTTECNKLISQFRLAEKAALGKDMTTESFMQLYQMDCPRAVERLLKLGIPEQIRASHDGDANDVAVTVAETVQFFITTMDAVKLEQRAVDELHPLLSELMDALTRLPETPNEFEPNRIVLKWLQKLNMMRAVEEIDEDDARQLSHDLDGAYAEFTRYLKRKK